MSTAYSVVIPVLNEEEAIPELYARLKMELEQITQSREDFEIIFVDDGSTDYTFMRLSEIANTDSRVGVIQFRKRYGKTAALATGFKSVTGVSRSLWTVTSSTIRRTFPGLSRRWPRATMSSAGGGKSA